MLAPSDELTLPVAIPDRADSPCASGLSPLAEEVTALFEQLRAPLFRYLLPFGLPVQDAEEIIQEVFLSLFQHLRRGKSRRNLRSWVFRVAHNLALKRRYRSRRDFQTVNGPEETREELAIDPAPSPEALAVNGQTQRRVLAALDALPERDRRCLSLRAEGLRYREIAEVLDMSLGGVSLSLSRSLARIMRAVER
jgi:RNA polymerase sigma-70 factor (ECF subfamily)